MKAKELQISKLDPNASYIIHVNIDVKTVDKITLNTFLSNLSKKLKSLGLFNFLLVPYVDGKPGMTFTQVGEGELEEI